MIIAQTVIEGFTLMSDDGAFGQYDVSILGG